MSSTRVSTDRRPTSVGADAHEAARPRADWIDSGIVHPDITKPSAVVFITKTIETLIAAGHNIPVLARNKYDLRKAISALVNDLRAEREVGQYNALFAANAGDFAVSANLSIIFDEQTYAPNQPFEGRPFKESTADGQHLS